MSREAPTSSSPVPGARGTRAPRRGWQDQEGLKAALDRLYTEYDRAAVIADPIELVRPYPDRRDREIVGFCAAALAFGRVASVIQSVGRLLAVLGPSPADYVSRFEPAREAGAFAPLVHRWTRGDDLVHLVLALRRMQDEAGSVEAFFLRGHDPASVDVGPALESFSARALALLPGGAAARPTGVSYFFPRPSTGSACKRLNLFLRWMVRRDDVDFGAWSGVRPSQLVVPLDVHVIRLGRCLGLTRYTSAGWRMASDITASLRRLDPDDPVKYDFALCHIGMHDRCGFNRPSGDAQCPLRGWCRPRPHTRPASRRPSVPR
jgi:uncharacterized protein (TIGR02757 family)